MLHTHKEGILYLEHCKLVASDDRLSFVRSDDAEEKFWSIPHAATGCILMGPGTSITQQAAKFLASENVMFGFVGGDGTPLFLASQSEYRPTEYLQAWCSFWFDDEQRLAVAKHFMVKRAEYTISCHTKLLPGNQAVQDACLRLMESAAAARNTEQLLGVEAVFAKQAYAIWAKEIRTAFTRDPVGADPTNRFLSHGNYLAYGIAAATLWVLGIPHALPVTHGKTRRGALVFDLADVIKTGTILPAAFMSSAESADSAGNRARCIAAMDQFKALSFLFQTMKEAIDVGCRR